MELFPNFNDCWWWWPFMAMQLCSYWWWSWSWTSGDIVTCQEKSALNTIESRCNSDDDDELTFKMSICLIPRINLDMQFKFSCGGKLTKAYICTSTGPPSNIHVHFSRVFQCTCKSGLHLYDIFISIVRILNWYRRCRSSIPKDRPPGRWYPKDVLTTSSG